MQNNKEQFVWNFANRLRGVVPFYGFSSTAIELVFMKYMSEFEDVYLPKQFKTLMSYKNMFISKTFEPSIVEGVFNIVEDVFNVEKGIITRTVDDLYKVFVDKPEFIFEVLNELELPKDSQEMTDFIEAILEYGDNKDVSRNNASSTNSSLAKLISEILDVKSNETYLDCFAGFSKTSLRIQAENYLGYEINPEIASISNIIMILSGKKLFDIKNQDFYLSQCHSVADKVLSDGPLGMILSPEQFHILGKESKKSDYYNIKCAMDALKENGRAVITCVSGVLFRNDLRKLRELLTFRNLKAVISLPPLWNFTSVPTNIIVLENERKGNDVIMIDASSQNYVSKLDRRTNLLTNEAIEMIIQSLNGKFVDGFSKSVPTEMILKANDEQSWVPAHYMDKKLDIDFRPSTEIEKELKSVYDELFDLLNK